MDQDKKNTALPLSIKILLPFFIGAFIICGIGWVYLRNHFQGEIEKQIKQRGEVFVKSIAHYAEISGDRLDLNSLIRSMGGENDVGLVALLKGREHIEVLAQGGSEAEEDASIETTFANFQYSDQLLQAVRLGQELHGIFKNTTENDYDYIYILPIRLKNESGNETIPGSVYLQLEVNAQLDDAEYDVRVVTFGLLLGMMALTSLKYSVLQYYVFKPIHTIKKAIIQRSEGDNAAYVTNLNNDEIGDVGGAFNEMVDKLEGGKKELLKQTIFLNTVIENIPLSLFAKDVKDNYRWVIWNKRSQEVFDMTPDRVLGKLDHDIFPKAEADFFHATDLAVIEGRKLIDIPEEPVTTSRGTWTAHTIKVPVYDEMGNPTMLMGILEDITERKAREKELEDARNAAISANKLKSEFLSNISHELRTPMHSIITFSRQGIERIQKWNLDEHAENLKLIHNSGERLLLLLNDLLDLSKLEAGVITYNIKKNDVNPIIQNAVRSLSSLAVDKNITIDFPAATISLGAAFDNEKLHQVIINLLSNAIKFTPAGSHIHIKTTHRDALGGSVLITVEDEGIGIPENELDHIFDKFIQSSKTKTGAGGTGLGLAICKEIIVGHGGKIWAENKPTGGALFSVLLPETLKHGDRHV